MASVETKALRGWEMGMEMFIIPQAWDSLITQYTIHKYETK